jgi:DNA-binding MarR family transcriptional regulator
MSSNGSRAFRGFIDLLQSQKSWLHERLSGFELTPQQFHALQILERHPDSTMREFAENMFCDASNATGLVDRLEQRTLVERRAAVGDRRAKVVRLTAAGSRLYKRIDDAVMGEAPPAIAKLSAADQRLLREIVERALKNVD